MFWGFCKILRTCKQKNCTGIDLKKKGNSTQKTISEHRKMIPLCLRNLKERRMQTSYIK